MILIISGPNDYSTDEVIRWLNYYKTPVERINYTDPVKIQDIKLNNHTIDFSILLNNRTIQYQDISGVYYRRGMLNIHPSTTNIISSNRSLNYLITNEIEILQDYLHQVIEEGNCIGNFKNRSLNKLRVLNLAKKHGIDFPQTYITSEKSTVEKLLQSSSLITKNISEVAHILEKENQHNSLTYAVDNIFIKNSSERFLYSLFQAKIKKDFEIRSFYLRGKFYSTAMFTQLNSKTNTDFRNYDDGKPTRIVPYQLPADLKEKLKRVFEELDINTGSVDMIYGNGKYYFLEINPVGQYGMISEPCNYYLERELVKDLIANQKN